MEIAPAVNYKIEGGKGIPAEANENEEVISELFDLSYTDFHYYQEKFLNKAHMNYLCVESDRGPIGLSVVRNDDNTYTALLRTAERNQKFNFPSSDVKNTFLRRIFGLSPPPASYVRAVSPTLPRQLKCVTNPALPQSFLEFEEKQTIKGFKFGILYCGPGQVKEDEMFTNDQGSPEFEEFLEFLGERVELFNWDRFRAGLDVTNRSTGEYSVFTEFNHNEIMFHVSTLLPHNAMDKQQLEKKRHIGNDLVVVIFLDGDQTYRPTALSSRQIQVVFLVKPELVDGKRFYRLAIVRRGDVPPFDPQLPADPLFEKGPDFHQFFYTKLLNAEKASYQTPIIASKLTRTRTALIQDLAKRYL